MKKFLTYIFILSAFVSCKTKKPIAQNPEPTKKSELTAYDRRKMDYLFFDGITLKLQGNLTQSLEKFQKCLAMDPSNSAVMYEIGTVLHGLGKNAEAVAIMKKAVAVDEKNIWYQVLLAECYKDLKQYSNEVGVFQRLIKNNPEKINLYYDLAAAQLYNNQPEDAIRTYDKIEEKIGITEELCLQKQRIYEKLKNINKAAAELQKLIDANPKEPKYYTLLGNLYLDAGQKEKAIEVYEKVLQIDASNGEIHLALADYYRETNQMQKSFEELKSAFGNTNLDADTKSKILLNFSSFIETDEKVKAQYDTLCILLVQTHPDNATAQYFYGDLLSGKKKYSEARDAFRKSAELDKNKFISWYEILLLDVELDDFESLQKESLIALEFFPTEPAPYLFLAVALIQFKKYDEAEENLKQGINFVIDNPALAVQFYAYLGEIYHKQKDYSSSDEAYDKAIEIDPNNVSTLNNYAYYLSVRNDKLEKAEKLAKKANELQPNTPSYLDTYGWVLYKMAKYKEAKEYIGRAIDNGAINNTVILEHYGDVLFKLGESAKALEYWEKAKKAGKGSDFLDKKIIDKKLYE